METPDLFNILAQPTERKPENNEFETEATQKSSPNPDDFEPAPEPEPEPKKGAFDEFIQKKEPEQISSKPILTDEEYNYKAKQMIATVDAIQSITLPFLYQKSLFKKKELEQLKSLKVKLKESGETSLNEKELELLDKYETFKELKQNVPFKEEEIEFLNTPLGAIFKKYNFQPSEEIMFLGVASAVIFPRYMPFISILEDE